VQIPLDLCRPLRHRPR